jgi:hypothetical protein
MYLKSEYFLIIRTGSSTVFFKTNTLKYTRRRAEKYEDGSILKTYIKCVYTEIIKL